MWIILAGGSILFIFGAILNAGLDLTTDQLLMAAMIGAVLAVAAAIEGRKKP